MYYSTLIARRKRAKIFIINRLTKIFVLYWLVLGSLYFIQPYKIDFYFLRNLFLLPGPSPILKVSWSLSYELYFYFLFGLTIYLLSGRYYKYAFVTMLVISTAITFLNITPFSVKGSALNFLAGQNLWKFLLGILSCAIFNKFTIHPAISGILSLAGLITITALSLAYASPASYIVYGALSFFVVVFTTMYEKGKVFGQKLLYPIKTLGDASYAMYLLGPVITDIILPASIITKVLTILIVIAASIMINKLIENKLLLLVRKSLSKLVK